MASMPVMSKSADASRFEYEDAPRLYLEFGRGFAECCKPFKPATTWTVVPLRLLDILDGHRALDAHSRRNSQRVVAAIFRVSAIPRCPCSRQAHECASVHCVPLC